MLKIIATSLTAIVLNSVSPALAATIDAENLIRGFSVIALGDYTLTSDTPSPVFVGGNFQSNGNSINNNNDRQDVTVGGVSGSLVVGGSVTSSGVSNVKGNVVIGANQLVTQPAPPQLRFEVDGTSTFNLNRAGTSVISGQTIPVDAVRTAFQSLSTHLAGLNDTGNTISGDENNKVLHATAGSDGIAVKNFNEGSFFDFFSGNGNRAFNLDDASTLILNMDLGGMADFTFEGLNINRFSGSNNVILNLTGVNTLNINSSFGISLLAPNVDVFANSGGADAFMVAYNLTQGYEIRETFTGEIPNITPVPLPASFWLLGFGILVFSFMRRRNVKPIASCG